MASLPITVAALHQSALCAASWALIRDVRCVSSVQKYVKRDGPLSAGRREEGPVSRKNIDTVVRHGCRRSKCFTGTSTRSLRL